MISVNTYSYGYFDADHKDAPTSYRGFNYSYDANGNQITRVNSANNSTQNRLFDPEGRLYSITEGNTTTESIYDANGARLVKRITTAGSKGDSVTSTLYIGNLYEEELTGGTTPPYTSYYTFGGKMVGMRGVIGSAESGGYKTAC